MIGHDLSFSPVQRHLILYMLIFFVCAQVSTCMFHKKIARMFFIYFWLIMECGIHAFCSKYGFSIYELPSPTSTFSFRDGFLIPCLVFNHIWNPSFFPYYLNPSFFPYILSILLSFLIMRRLISSVMIPEMAPRYPKENQDVYKLGKLDLRERGGTI